MAKAQRSENDLVTCSICMGDFIEPKILPCLHRFCEPCLNRHITEPLSEGTKQHWGFTCPCCRAFTPSPNPTRPRSEWAAQFKTDFAFKELISFRSTGKAGINDPCPTHIDVERDYYCVGCSIKLCHRCALQSHRECQHVVDFNEADNDCKKKLIEAINQTQTELQQLTKSENLHTCFKYIIETERNRVAREIKSWGDDVRKRVADEEMKLLKQLDTKCEDLFEKVQSEMLQVKEIKDSANSRFREVLSSLSLEDNKTNLDKNMNLLRECQKNDLPKVHDILNGINAHVYGIKVTFRNRPSGFQGNISVATDVTKSANTDTLSKVNNSNIGEPSISGITFEEHHDIQVIRTIDTRHGRNDTYINSIIAVTPSNNIVVTQGNCVRMYSSTRDTNTSVTLECEPWGLTQVSDTSVAVTLPIADKLCLIQCLQSIHSLDVLSYTNCKPYRSLAALDASTLVATDYYRKPCIDVIDLTGQVLKSINMNSIIPGIGIYNSYLCVTPDKMILCYSSPDNCLLCLPPDGKIKFMYWQRDVWSMTCDSSGRIFLATSNSLLTLTSDGHPDKTFICSENTSSLTGSPVCVDRQGLLYMVHWSKVIEVFSLSGPHSTS
ncbi:hypothetical protein BsWGS_01016 [Bradybaena similaris]